MVARMCFFITVPILMMSCAETKTWDNGRWIDLTYEFSEETIFWPTSGTFSLDTVFVGETDAGFYYESYEFCTAEHGGTHLDAPVHFSEGKKTVEELKIENLTGQAVVIDVSDKVETDRDYQILPEDITNWESNFGRMPDHSILLFMTGFGAYWPDAETYLGTNKRGEEALSELSFPGIHPEAAEWLVNNRKIKAVGLDTPSLDFGRATLFKTHQILFEQNIPGFENVANLDQLPPTGAYIIALPMKIKGGSGAPLRIVAHLGSN